MTSLHLWRSFFRGKMNSSARLVHKSCGNDGTSALKLAEIMWKNKLVTVAVLCFFIYEAGNFWNNPHTTTMTVILRPVVWDYPGEPVPAETFTHPPFWSSSNLYELLPCTTIHSILPVQIMCLAIFLHNFYPHPLWSTSWSGAIHLIFHTFLHRTSVFFSQHMPIPSQPVLL